MLKTNADVKHNASVAVYVTTLEEYLAHFETDFAAAGNIFG